LSGPATGLQRCSASWAICTFKATAALTRFNPRLYRMLFDIIRFNLFATDLLQKEGKANEAISIGEYLDKGGYSDAFKQDYLFVRRDIASLTSP
jgi:predicted NAD/FAD-binding protein